jgi:hypothetical protein
MNSTILNLLNQTTVNNNQNTDFVRYSVGDVIDNKFKVLDVISFDTSGEADIYKVKTLESNEVLVVKIYRRKNSVKQDVLKKLETISNENIGRILESGEIEGFQYLVLPFYKNNSLANV